MQVNLPDVDGQRVDAGLLDKTPGRLDIAQSQVVRPFGQLMAHALQRRLFRFNRRTDWMGLCTQPLHAVGQPGQGHFFVAEHDQVKSQFDRREHGIEDGRFVEEKARRHG